MYIPHYYRNVHAVIFVYDVTQTKSFENIEKWVEEFLLFVEIINYLNY